MQTRNKLPFVVASFGFLAVAGLLVADLPYGNNQPEGRKPSSLPALSIGNVPDRAVPGYIPTYVGAPSTAVIEYLLDAPAAADADYFANDLVVSAAADVTGSLLQTVNQKNSVDGLPFCRNVVVTPSEATTGTLVLRVIDAQGRNVSRSVSFTNASAAVTSAWTCRQIVSATVTSAFSDGTVDIGTGVIFGLSYPMYANTILHDFFDTDGTGYPASAVTVTAVAGDPSSATADIYGTVSFGSDAPDATNDYALWYIPSVLWTPDGTYPTSAWSQMR